MNKEKKNHSNNNIKIRRNPQQNSVIQKKYYKTAENNQKTASLSLSSIKYLEENNTKTFLEKQNKDCARVGDFKVPDC